MAVISVVGTSGVGKSFLVRQLAALDCAPGFFEGEEGAIPDEIFKSVFTGSPLGRFRYFIGAYGKRLEKARRISEQLKMDCYVDGAVLSADAILLYECKEYRDELKKLNDSIRAHEADRILLLTLSKKKLREFIAKRARKSEDLEKTFARAWKIQVCFLKAAKSAKRVLVLDRSKLDFSKEKDLKKVKALLI